MGTTNHFDLIVLGDDLAGLIVAALVAGRGQRVCVLPGSLDPAAPRGGGQVPEVDAVPFLPASSPFVRATFEELGQWLQVRRELEPQTGTHHWRLPDVALDLKYEESNFGAEWTRVTGDVESGRGDAVMAQMQAQMRSLLRAARIEVPRSRTMGALESDARTEPDTPPPFLPPAQERQFARHLGLEATTALFSDAAPSTVPVPARYRLRQFWREGPRHWRGGTAAMRALLSERIRFKSSTVNARARVAEVEFKRGRVQGVRLQARGERYGCDALLLAQDPAALIPSAIDPAGFSKGYATALTSVSRPYQRVVCLFGVHPAGLPVGFSRSVVATAEPSTHAGGFAQHLLVRRISPPASNKAGDEVCLAATRVLPSNANLDTLRRDTLEAMEAHAGFPFLSRHVRWSHCPHDPHGVIEGAHGSPMSTSGESRPPVHLYAFQETSLDSGLPVDTGIRGLHYAGRMAHPALGAEGQFIAALTAADRICPPQRGTSASARLLRRR